MKTITLLLLIPFLLKSSSKPLCDCGWGGEFIDNVKSAGVILRGSVSKRIVKKEHKYGVSYRYVQIKIDEVLKGKYEKDSILIEGANGINCLARLTEFNKGTEWVVILSSELNEKSYGLDGCGEYYVRYKDDMVLGLFNLDDGEYLEYMNEDPFSDTIYSKLDTMKYSDLIEKIGKTTHNKN